MGNASPLIADWPSRLVLRRLSRASPDPGALRGAALRPLLASPVGLGSGLAIQDRRLIPLAVGGTLFLLSDLILAGDMFSDLFFRLIGGVVWLTYGPVQVLIF